MFELDPTQLLWITVIASLLVQVIRFAGGLIGKPVPEVWIKWIVFAISVALGVFWFDGALPVFPGFGGDPLEVVALLGFVGEWVALAVTFMVLAEVVYKALLKKVFDAIKPLRL